MGNFSFHSMEKEFNWLLFFFLSFVRSSAVRFDRSIVRLLLLLDLAKKKKFNVAHFKQHSLRPNDDEWRANDEKWWPTKTTMTTMKKHKCSRTINDSNVKVLMQFNYFSLFHLSTPRFNKISSFFLICFEFFFPLFLRVFCYFMFSFCFFFFFLWILSFLLIALVLLSFHATHAWCYDHCLHPIFWFVCMHLVSCFAFFYTFYSFFSQWPLLLFIPLLTWISFHFSFHWFQFNYIQNWLLIHHTLCFFTSSYLFFLFVFASFINHFVN